MVSLSTGVRAARFTWTEQAMENPSMCARDAGCTPRPWDVRFREYLFDDRAVKGTVWLRPAPPAVTDLRYTTPIRNRRNRWLRRSYCRSASAVCT